LTSFVAFEVEATAGQKCARHRFVLNLPLVNAPPARKDAVLRSLLHNREAVLHLLLMLLFGDTAPEPGDAGAVGGFFGDGQSRLFPPLPLFECLMRALDRSPHRVEDVARLVEDLRRTPDGNGLLPEGFDRIWPAIVAVRAKLSS
jgi:hypothetical protein